MKKKICVVHGVGFFHDEPKEHICSFVAKLKEKTCADVVVHRWEHIGSHPVDPRSSLFFTTMKNWTHEVIMDFAYVVANLPKLAADLPDADMYVGHSAGGVIISQTTKPQVLMGCPIQLIEDTKIKTASSNVLNLMNYRDPIAAPVAGAYNMVTYHPLVAPFFNPVSAHTGYWESDSVMRRILEFYKIKIQGV